MRAVRRDVDYEAAPRVRRPRAARPQGYYGERQRPYARRARRPEGRVARWWRGLKARMTSTLTLAAIVGGLFVAVLIYGAFAGGHVARWRDAGVAAVNNGFASLGFAVESVTLSGRRRAPKAEILSAVGLSRGDPIFAVSTEGIRARLLANRWIAEATVQKFLPGTIAIAIVEREPFAIWQMGGKLNLIDATGHVITDENVQSYAGLPLVVDKGANEAAPTLIAALQHHPKIAAQMAAAVRYGERRWDLHMKSGVVVKLPEDDEEASLLRLEGLILEQDVLRRAVTTIDLRLPDRLFLTPDQPTSLPGRGEPT